MSRCFIRNSSRSSMKLIPTLTKISSDIFRKIKRIDNVFDHQILISLFQCCNNTHVHRLLTRSAIRREKWNSNSILFKFINMPGSIVQQKQHRMVCSLSYERKEDFIEPFRKDRSIIPSSLLIENRAGVNVI